ncbi:LexA family protein [Candidatus Magnetaquicoccus inordinatus]|uniref:LexA family protein n=1 Tax=Candidatus Magnetaquicoccus inordinatus TaxID=2496818 RepID=UPI00102ABBDC|nr:S24 family peptidase [Candidatus Magnetaquicoccus inordinatus]
MSPPVNNDLHHLSRLQDYYARHRTWPSYSRLGSILGLQAKSAVAKLLHRLEEQGYIERSPDETWSPTDRFFTRPLADLSVRAGMPEWLADGSEHPVLIDALLVKTPSRTVLLPVQGDSMRDAGIHEGDLVVVERCQSAAPGTLVVAAVDGEFTLKTLIRDEQGWALQAAHPDYPLIRPRQELSLFGVVTGLIRRYGQP